jgi:hypothetical protein
VSAMASWRVAQKMQMSREEVTWDYQRCDGSIICGAQLTRRPRALRMVGGVERDGNSRCLKVLVIAGPLGFNPQHPCPLD